MEANNEGFQAQHVHAIGFSLGAHVVSFTSNALEKAIGIKFNRITGRMEFNLIEIDESTNGNWNFAI